MKEILITKNNKVLIDDNDFEVVNKFKWHTHKNGKNTYACRVEYNKDGSKRKIYLHQFIMKANGLIVDHANGNGLDNRRCNLRICTNLQNSMNRTPVKNHSSKFKGVSKRGENGKFRSYIRIDKKLKHLGTFDHERDAAFMYDIWAERIFKNFSRLNFPVGVKS